MRKVQVILTIVFFSWFLIGCGLIPKKVEYFQKEIKEVPAPDKDHQEKQKQAAEFVQRKSIEAFTQAVVSDSPTNVVKPIKETRVVAESLAGSLGKPLDRWEGSAEALAIKLNIEDALLDRRMERFRERNDEMIGSKIEGSGLISLPYFANFAIFGILALLAYIIMKVLSALHPGVSIGTKVLGGGILGVSKMVSNLAKQVVLGGENFKKKIDEKIDDVELRKKIKELFITAQKEEQSPEVKEAIKKLIS